VGVGVGVEVAIPLLLIDKAACSENAGGDDLPRFDMCIS
jgi:hypothetical protein